MTGPWGVGKTTALRKMIEKYRGHAVVKRYSYASVFGAQTPAEIKTALMTRRQEFPVPTAEQLDKRGRVTHAFVATRKRILGWSKRAGLRQTYESLRDALPYGGKNVFVALESLAGAVVYDSLIVLDDIERLGKNLSLEHLMGFIAELRDEFRCRVIIVFNEDGFTKPEDKETFDRFAEKVVDLRLKFELASKEAVEIGLPEDTPLRDLISNAVTQLDITNLRVIERIHSAVDMMFPLVAGSSVPVHQQFATTVCVCACSIYERGRGFPKPAELLNFNVYTLGAAVNQEPDQPWRALLRAVGFTAADEFDTTVMEVMQHGYVADLKLTERAQAMDAIVDGSRKRKVFDDAWSLFHDHIDATAADVANALSAAVAQSAETISANHLDATVRLLRQLGFTELADQAIETFIEMRRNTPSVFDVDLAAGHGDMQDTTVISRFREAFLQSTRSISLWEAAARVLTADEGWDDEILAAFLNAKPVELVKVLQDFQGPHLRQLIAAIYRMPTRAAERDAIGQTLHATLRMIADISPINAMRVKNWGYQVD